MKSFIRIMALVLLTAMLLPMSACDSGRTSGKVETVKIGISLYRKDDTFVASLCTYLEKVAKQKEAESGKKIVVNMVDGQSSQALQNDQVDSFISQNYDVVCVNMVDRTAAAVIVDKAKAANIPVIFFNREPVEEDLRLWERAYYVGADAAESGRLQGQIIAEGFAKNRAEIDKNGDGKIQYVMLEGEQGHQDALLRTEYSIKAVTGAGIQVEKLANDTANWQRAQGSAKMTQWLAKFGSRIEVVFCNNDDMALGAIDALKDSKSKVHPVIVGVDATESGLNAIKDGSMFGTVFNDAQGQAKAIFDLSYALASGESQSSQLNIQSGHYIRIPYRAVTESNADEILSILKE
ncbi:galactose ABC transporter substrate-binding protein [Caproiciproducens faecalis]|uniref:D-galactose/methyl-galactoside binding periplasmic protein MglB n=1 Tax=Caproiciproducens faecalis TaxID=2820301 RepID=A0ABS7DP54_9FIRM|nr:galactose ABC transporter substrate-binding protein [Caproiciproducens faecalis]MBW7573057.1 galactose ABC transporter substrate-binding protein [Caproiciproducens faecalis]